MKLTNPNSEYSQFNSNSQNIFTNVQSQFANFHSNEVNKDY